MSATVASSSISVTHQQPMLVLPSDFTFSFLVEPTITLRSCSSSSDGDGDEEDDDGFQVPFTTSPLDECRGATKSKESVRGVTLHATTSFTLKKKATTAARRRKNTKAATMRAAH